MASYRYSYLLELSFLGFRYSGYQAMPGQLTIEGMLRKTLEFCFGPKPRYNVISASRTDAKVSAEQFWVQLFCDRGLDDDYFSQVRLNLPADIDLKSYKSINADFSLMDEVQLKVYQYRIDQGAQKDVFRADRAYYLPVKLDLSLVRKACDMMQGEHDFKSFTVKNSKQNTTRFLNNVAIENKGETVVFSFESKGFLRYQIRMIMAALIEVGLTQLSLEEFGQLLLQPHGPFPKIAPASGLTLKKIVLS